MPTSIFVPPMSIARTRCMCSPYGASTAARPDRSIGPRPYAFSRNDQGGGFVTTTGVNSPQASSGNRSPVPGSPTTSPRSANVGRAIEAERHSPDGPCAVAEEHVLVEDVPGVGKTSIGKAFARSVDGRFDRVQFTQNLLPTDVTGVSVWNQSSARSSSVPSRCSAMSCSPTRSAAPRKTVSAARSDGRTPGDGRRRDPPAPDTVHGDRHTEPHRA